MQVSNETSVLQDPKYGTSRRGFTALHYAVAFQHADIVGLLLSDPRVDPNVLGLIPSRLPLEVRLRNFLSLNFDAHWVLPMLQCLISMSAYGMARAFHDTEMLSLMEADPRVSTIEED